MRRYKVTLFDRVLTGTQHELSRQFAIRMLNAHPQALDPEFTSWGKHLIFHWYAPYKMSVWCFAESAHSIKVMAFTQYGETPSKDFVTVDGAVDYVSPSLRLDTTLQAR